MERRRNPGNGSLRSDMPVRTVVSASTGSSHAQKDRKGEMGHEPPSKSRSLGLSASETRSDIASRNSVPDFVGAQSGLRLLFNQAMLESYHRHQ
jgi:hypothetical protein